MIPQYVADVIRNNLCFRPLNRRSDVPVSVPRCFELYQNKYKKNKNNKSSGRARRLNEKMLSPKIYIRSWILSPPASQCVAWCKDSGMIVTLALNCIIVQGRDRRGRIGSMSRLTYYEVLLLINPDLRYKGGTKNSWLVSGEMSPDPPRHPAVSSSAFPGPRAGDAESTRFVCLWVLFAKRWRLQDACLWHIGIEPKTLQSSTESPFCTFRHRDEDRKSIGHILVLWWTGRLLFYFLCSRNNESSQSFKHTFLDPGS